MSSFEGNTAPPITPHTLTQLLLSLCLPILIVPLVAAAGYFAFRWFRNRKCGDGNVESCVKDSGSSSSGPERASGSGSESESQAFEMKTPALATNSVQVPRVG